MKKWAPVLAALAVAALVAIPLGLGHAARSAWPGATGSSESVSLADWRGDDVPDVGAAVRAQALEVLTSIGGTEYQRNALSVIHAYEGNGVMDQCMADAGHPEWDWSLTRQYADPDDPLKTNEWLAMPMSRWRSHDLVPARPFLMAERVMNAPETDAYADDVTACGKVARRQQVEHAYSDDEPDAVESLQTEWFAFVGQFEHSELPDVKQYEACMLDSNLTIMEGIEPEAFGSMVGYAMSGASPPDDSIPTNPEDADQWADSDWQRFLGLEDEFDKRDWKCRQDVYTQHIGELAPAIDEWVAQHQEAIAEATTYWKGVESKARALGFTGQSGSLDGIVGNE